MRSLNDYTIEYMKHNCPSGDGMSTAGINTTERGYGENKCINCWEYAIEQYNKELESPIVPNGFTF